MIWFSDIRISCVDNIVYIFLAVNGSQALLSFGTLKACVATA